MFMHLLACGSAPLSPMLPCPPKHNCVSSLADPADPEHYVEPFEAERWTDVVAAIEAQPRVQILSSTLDYRHYTFTTPVFGFTDDLELQLGGDHTHIRSASRVGNRDFGVNRHRVQTIRAAVATGN